MKYLLIMSFSGSTMVVIYMLFRILLRDQMPARLQYLLVKIAALFYLIPLPFVKDWYVALAGQLRPKRESVSNISAVWAGCMVHANEKTYINEYLKVQMLIIIVWILAAVMWLMYELKDYCKTRKRVLNCADQVLTREESICLEQMKKRCGVMRKVTVYQDEAGGKTITFGFFKPVILCDQKPGTPDAELLLCHELIHIKRCDVWWKMLVQCVVMLHWWNPVAWILFRDYERASEWSCDEIVVQDRTRNDIKRYLYLLIQESMKKEVCGRPYRSWVTGFGSDARKLKKRMDNVMRMKKWNKAMMGAIVGVFVLANSLTVLAYEDTVREVVQEDMSQDEVEYFMEGETWQFIPEETMAETSEGAALYIPCNIETKYEDQFVNTEGEIFQIQADMVQEKETVSVYRSCNHECVPGTRVMHDKKSDGSCLVKVYEAERCTKCGLVFVGSQISETKYMVCPH